MNKIKNVIKEEIVNLFEKWLGISDIDKKTHQKIKESGKYWALFAHLYENHFSKINKIDDVDTLKNELLKKTDDRRAHEAIIFFSDLRKKEIEFEKEGKNIDDIPYIELIK